MSLLFWICLSIIIYSYLGYGVILFCLVKLKLLIKGKTQKPFFEKENLPTCSILIAAYNEQDIIRKKILNTLSLNYPKELLKIYVVLDGSTDQTVQIISEFEEINMLYQPLRKGKIAAIDRAMQYINSEIVIFTDANTFLNNDAITEICHHYSDPKVGCIAGEKRIYNEEKADASSAGESFYWKYESKLKEWDSELYSTIGAAGELFSIRRSLYESVPENTILDDFMLSMKISCRNYRIAYEPKAYATELSSANIKEELKRKIRIAAGGIQSVLYLKELLNPFKYPILSFQYISHRVLRWTITPFLLILVFFINIHLAYSSINTLYKILLISQCSFYFLALIGYTLEKRHLKFKSTFIPYYFCMMNYAIIAGIIRFFKKEQNVLWDKAKRKEEPSNTELLT